jgi:hypothetical protein
MIYFSNIIIIIIIRTVRSTLAVISAWVFFFMPICLSRSLSFKPHAFYTVRFDWETKRELYYGQQRNNRTPNNE